MFLCVGLDVSEPNPPSEQLLQVCQNITITVNISGSPVPWIASFVRDDGRNISNKGNRVNISGNAIIFWDLEEDDVAGYIITISNGDASSMASFNLTAPCESQSV